MKTWSQQEKWIGLLSVWWIMNGICIQARPVINEDVIFFSLKGGPDIILQWTLLIDGDPVCCLPLQLPVHSSGLGLLLIHYHERHVCQLALGKPVPQASHSWGEKKIWFENEHAVKKERRRARLTLLVRQTGKSDVMCLSLDFNLILNIMATIQNYSPIQVWIIMDKDTTQCIKWAKGEYTLASRVKVTELTARSLISLGLTGRLAWGRSVSLLWEEPPPQYAPEARPWVLFLLSPSVGQACISWRFHFPSRSTMAMPRWWQGVQTATEP